MNKTDIINNMLKFAASELNLPNTGMLDPLVYLFIESLAEEIYKLTDQIENVEERILDKMANILTLSDSIVAKPSHAILHAKSLDNDHVVTKETEFCFKDPHKKSEEYKFYPVCNTLIHNGDVMYMITNNIVFSIDSNREKTIKLRPYSTENMNKNTFWIGLSLNEEVTLIKNLSFYFDFPTVKDKNDYLELLQYTVWKINDKKVNLKQGLYEIPSKYKDDNIELFSSLDISNIIDKKIKEKYNKHYVTINLDITSKENFPEILKDNYPSFAMDDFIQPLLWIEVEYPETFKTEIIENMHININTFPVANKILRTEIADVNSVLQIVPLETNYNEYFISINSIQDSKGNDYHELPFRTSSQLQGYTYSLRRGGFERYGVRDLRDYMQNLSVSLNMHSNSFSTMLDTEADLSKLSEQINMLADQLKRAVSEMQEKREVPSYIIIEQLLNDETLFIKYWLTNCQLANDIKSGSKLNAVSDINIINNSIILLSATTGGHQPPNSADRNNLYRQELSSEHSIVSDDDIIEFFKSEFSNIIDYVEIRNGIEISSTPKDDLVRTTDIYLTPYKDAKLLFQSKDSTEYFRYKLIKNSPESFNYRIFLETEKI